MNQIEPNDSDELKVKGVTFAFGDIRKVVKEFYRRVPEDEALRIPFQSVRDWPHHLERLTHFWWTRFGGTPYRSDAYDPVGKHLSTGFTRTLLSRWLTLFQDTLEGCLRPDQAELWAVAAERMGNAMAFQNELLARGRLRRSGGVQDTLRNA